MIFPIVAIFLLVSGASFCGRKAYVNRCKNSQGWVIALIIFSFLIVTSIPFLINELYKTNSGYETLWNADDVFSFYGSFLAFLGTVSLGALALWQNANFKKANDEKDMLFLEIESEKIRLNNLPQFLVQTANAEKCVDIRYKLSEQYALDHVALDKFKTYGFFIKPDSREWIPDDKHPVIKKGTENRIFSIVNCGNNTAHQVKLSISFGEEIYSCEKATSISKDDEIFFYFGLNKAADIRETIILTVRYFDCFQNVYEQKFEIKNTEAYLYLISFSDVLLIKRNDSMNILHKRT